MSLFSQMSRIIKIIGTSKCYIPLPFFLWFGRGSQPLENVPPSYFFLMESYPGYFHCKLYYKLSVEIIGFSHILKTKRGRNWKLPFFYMYVFVELKNYWRRGHGDWFPVGRHRGAKQEPPP